MVKKILPGVLYVIAGILVAVAAVVERDTLLFAASLVVLGCGVNMIITKLRK